LVTAGRRRRYELPGDGVVERTGGGHVASMIADHLPRLLGLFRIQA
jgi:hypothetical protein